MVAALPLDTWFSVERRRRSTSQKDTSQLGEMAQVLLLLLLDSPVLLFFILLHLLFHLLLTVPPASIQDGPQC